MKPSDRLKRAAYLDVPDDQLDRAARAAGFSMHEDEGPTRHTMSDDVRDDRIFFAVMIGLVVFVAGFTAVGIYLLGWWR